MDEAIDIVLRHSLCNTLGSFYVYVLKIKIPAMFEHELQATPEEVILGRIVPSDKIVNDIRMSDAFF